MSKIILGIESSCDETGAAILSRDGDKITILSNILSSSAELQSSFGGIFPEQAAREQLKLIIPIISQAMKKANVTKDSIDAIAVTQGPGLIGSLLIGVETAKTLSLVWQKPLIPINHLIAHFYPCWLQTPQPIFPFLGLLVSGGHTDLVVFKGHTKYDYLGGTRDDAAGECFDKCARLLDLPYPGGPQISKLGRDGNPNTYKLPVPMLGSKDFDFSFSGLKTSVANLVKNTPNINKSDLCASIEQTITKSLVTKALSAAKSQNLTTVILAGGVAANTTLRQTLEDSLKKEVPNSKLFIPPIELCTDNAVSTAANAFFTKPTKNPLEVEANPNLSLSH